MAECGRGGWSSGRPPTRSPTRSLAAATQVVFYYGVLAEEEGSSAGRLFTRFCAGTDAFRNARFKLIPSVAEGPWLVKTGVGSRPSILGKSLKQRFARGDGARCVRARAVRFLFRAAALSRNPIPSRDRLL